MTESALEDRDEISFFAVGTMLLQHRWRIVRWTFIGGLVAALTVLFKPVLYAASTSFMPQVDTRARGGLADLAGQFGVSLPTATQSLSPDFYSELLTSRVLLLPVVRDTFMVSEMGGQRVSFLDLFKIAGSPAARREERGVAALKTLVTVNVEQATGVVQVSVSTPWRSVSLAMVTELVNGVNQFNERMRQGQATAERKFVEGRLAVAGTDLRQAEDRLEAFLKANRQSESSPELTFQRERLQREVGLRQQIFTSLTQAYEDARIREVRNTPVISIFEPPAAPMQPEPRGRLKRGLLGLMLGGLAGTVLVFTSGMMARQREEGDSDADAFVSAWREMKGELLRPVLRLRKRTQS